MALPLAGVLTTVLVGMLGSAIARLLIGGGLALIAYQSLSGYMESFLSNWAQALSGLPSDMLTLLTMAGLPAAMEIIGSAMLTVAAIRLTDRVVGVRITS